jgi:FMN phosphatase YigB (HAD superfamily)
MAKAVVFDLGKVLVDFDYLVAARKIAAGGKMTAQEVMSFLSRSPSFPAFERGTVDRKQLFAEICAVTGFTGSMEEFGGYFADIFTSIEPMVELNRTLRAKGIPTYIFSNTNDLAIEHIRRSFPFFSQFTGYIYSYQHGFLKPEAGLYEAVERESGFKGADILYLDDRPENVAAGAQRGWQVILHESPDASVKAVRALGILT